MSVSLTQDFLSDLFSRRAISGGGTQSEWLMELGGASIIQPTAFEPDPATHNQGYYYNSSHNALYRKVVTRTEPVIVAHWQRVSQ